VYKHMLIATDGSELGSKAVTSGLTLAKTLGSKVTIVTVTEPWTATMTGEFAVTFPVDEYDRACVARAESILTPARAEAQKAGVPAEAIHVKDRFPAEGIFETATAKGCDLIVMSSHGRRGLSRLLLGSQANKVVTMSTLPVLICR
jgi:nucleotide-binding universal stress UspA family protein